MCPGQALSLPSSILAGIWGLSVRMRFNGWQIGLRRLGHQSPEQEGELVDTAINPEQSLSTLATGARSRAVAEVPRQGATG